MVQIEDRIARGGADLRHVAADCAVHAVVRVEFELGLGADPALPLRVGAVLAARPHAAERLKVGTGEHARHHLRPDHVVGQRVGAGQAGARVVERVAARIALGEGRRQLPLRRPIPVGQCEVRLLRQAANDVFQRRQIGAVPRQEVPVAVWAERAMDVGKARPVAGSDGGSAFMAATPRL